MTFDEAIEHVGRGVDAAGVAVIVIGVLVAAITTVRHRPFTERSYRLLRQRVGRAILLGLELLVAADIIQTVAIRPTLTSAGVLAIIVLIRTFLSFSLEVELDGRWPWSGGDDDERGRQDARVDGEGSADEQAAPVPSQQPPSRSPSRDQHRA